MQRQVKRKYKFRKPKKFFVASRKSKFENQQFRLSKTINPFHGVFSHSYWHLCLISKKDLTSFSSVALNFVHLSHESLASLLVIWLHRCLCGQEFNRELLYYIQGVVGHFRISPRSESPKNASTLFAYTSVSIEQSKPCTPPF